jgi:hypothetical protein
MKGLGSIHARHTLSGGMGLLSWRMRSSSAGRLLRDLGVASIHGHDFGGLAETSIKGHAEQACPVSALEQGTHLADMVRRMVGTGDDLHPAPDGHRLGFVHSTIQPVPCKEAKHMRSYTILPPVCSPKLYTRVAPTGPGLRPIRSGFTWTAMVAPGDSCKAWLAS